MDGITKSLNNLLLFMDNKITITDLIENNNMNCKPSDAIFAYVVQQKFIELLDKYNGSPVSHKIIADIVLDPFFSFDKDFMIELCNTDIANIVEFIENKNCNNAEKSALYFYYMCACSAFGETAPVIGWLVALYRSVIACGSVFSIDNDNKDLVATIKNVIKEISVNSLNIDSYLELITKNCFIELNSIDQLWS